MATPTAEVKRVRFSVEEDRDSHNSDEAFEGQWDFLKYLLTLREEINVNSVVDSLVQKGVISADAGSDVMRQGTPRAQVELCVQEVMKGSGPAYRSLCETLQEHGYTNIVDALKGDANLSSIVPEFSDVHGNTTPRLLREHWSQRDSVVDGFSVQGKKMALSALSRDAKASQREFSVIVERQQELEKQLVQVMKSLDRAKDMLIAERQEKLGLREQLRSRDEELVAMQRKYLELQKAMSSLRETNNKYTEKVTRLQIENEQLRKGVRERHELESELRERNGELGRLRDQLTEQEAKMRSQEEKIVSKLAMIERVVGEHKTLVDGQEKLTKKINLQANDIIQLHEEKDEAASQMAAQQRQLNFQQAQIGMIQEQMQRLEGSLGGGGGGGGAGGTYGGSSSRAESLPPLPSTPGNDGRNSRYIHALSKSMNLNRPFNPYGKLENSKNMLWRGDSSGKKGK
ncbi:keratin, type I cytoskeletal 10-like [Mya arenaria]|uniref:keratin, type I cytoskeletal 10-like n=1 Tax=Mya arenaria TaxID=6604 RepID=UPI0022DF0EFB|nr:keratin, type I cytoskeletal 10-like [Mya arenaria]